MRTILLKTRHIDRQSEVAASKIATALSMGLPQDLRTVAMVSVGELRLKIHDLQRENTELRFQVENPDFDLDDALETEQSILESFRSGLTNFSTLVNRYDYDYFSDHNHPGFLQKLSMDLCAACMSKGIDIPEIWEYLHNSSGLLTEEFTNQFEPLEVDKGTV